MKCRNCSCAKRGYFPSVPEAYVCTGVKEPFIINDYPDAECTQYKDENVGSTINDGIYMELFAVKNGARYNAKIMDMKEATIVLTNSLMDGIEKLWT